MPTDRILTCRCDTTLVGRGRSSDSEWRSRDVDDERREPHRNLGVDKAERLQATTSTKRSANACFCVVRPGNGRLAGRKRPLSACLFGDRGGEPRSIEGLDGGPPERVLDTVDDERGASPTGHEAEGLCRHPAPVDINLTCGPTRRRHEIVVIASHRPLNHRPASACSRRISGGGIWGRQGRNAGSYTYPDMRWTAAT